MLLVCVFGEYVVNQKKKVVCVEKECYKKKMTWVILNKKKISNSRILKKEFDEEKKKEN